MLNNPSVLFLDSTLNLVSIDKREIGRFSWLENYTRTKCLKDYLPFIELLSNVKSQFTRGSLLGYLLSSIKST
jgi:hypothetical protein